MFTQKSTIRDHLIRDCCKRTSTTLRERIVAYEYLRMWSYRQMYN